MEFGENPLDFQIPDVAEPIRGYRSWFVEYADLGDNKGTLVVSSQFGRDPWVPGEGFAAYCGNYQIPGADRMTRGNSCGQCPSPSKEGHHGFGCGIYSYKEPTRAAAYHDPRSYRNGIWGEILMWGEVYEHEHGYRAQYAIPSAFGCMRDTMHMDAAYSLAAQYGVPLIPDMREMSEEGRWNPLTRTLEATMTEVDYLLDRSLGFNKLFP